MSIFYTYKLFIHKVHVVLTSNRPMVAVQYVYLSKNSIEFIVELKNNEIVYTVQLICVAQRINHGIFFLFSYVDCLVLCNDLNFCVGSQISNKQTVYNIWTR